MPWFERVPAVITSFKIAEQISKETLALRVGTTFLNGIKALGSSSSAITGFDDDRIAVPTNPQLSSAWVSEGEGDKLVYVLPMTDEGDLEKYKAYGQENNIQKYEVAADGTQRIITYKYRYDGSGPGENRQEKEFLIKSPDGNISRKFETGSWKRSSLQGENAGHSGFSGRG